MAEVIKTYTVTGRGTGRPDFHTSSIPGRTILTEAQTAFNLALDIDIAPGSTGIIPLYLVPEGYQLNVTYFKVSTSESCISYAEFYSDGTLIGGMYIDTAAFGQTGESGAYVWGENEVLGYMAYNPLDHNIHGKGRIAGTLTHVP